MESGIPGSGIHFVETVQAVIHVLISLQYLEVEFLDSG